MDADCRGKKNRTDVRRHFPLRLSDRLCLRMETEVLWVVARQLFSEVPLIYLLFLTLNFSTALPTKGIERNLGTFNARDVFNNASSLSDNRRARRKHALQQSLYSSIHEIHETCEFQKKPGETPNMHIYRDVQHLKVLQDLHSNASYKVTRGERMDGGIAHNVVSFLFEDPDEGSRIERESRKWRVIGRWKHNLLANRRRMRAANKGER